MPPGDRTRQLAEVWFGVTEQMKMSRPGRIQDAVVHHHVGGAIQCTSATPGTSLGTKHIPEALAVEERRQLPLDG